MRCSDLLTSISASVPPSLRESRRMPDRASRLSLPGGISRRFKRPRTLAPRKDPSIGVLASSFRCQRAVSRKLGNYTSRVGRVQEREAGERQAKLEHIREQVSSGALVIRQMTRAERVRWNEQRSILEATFTRAERTRRDSLLRTRRQRAERLLGNAP
jgi:hypothetical protein